jgi:creatinine amidohydrolase
MKYNFFLLFLLINGLSFSQQRNKKNKAIFLEDISWTEAQKVLTSDVVIVIPLGAGAKEHGPHLPLATDFIQAEGLRDIIALERKVIIAPTVNYGYYPAFVKYPGSTTTYWNTSRDMVLQIIRTLAGFGPKRFYIINIGVSTTPTLIAAASILKDEGIVLYYSDYSRPNFDNSDKGIRTKGVYSGHADEMESSHVLFYRNDLVNMSKAVNDSSVKDRRGPMTPVPLEGGTYNPTGINGYAALATKQKGKLYAQVFANELLKDIDSVANCVLPVAKDRSEQYKVYEGVYDDASGKKLVIGQEDNHLYYIWNGIDQRKFYPLYYEDADMFSSVPFEILFIRNERNEVIKAWCSLRGETFWVTKK